MRGGGGEARRRVGAAIAMLVGLVGAIAVPTIEEEINPGKPSCPLCGTAVVLAFDEVINPGIPPCRPCEAA